MPYPSLPIGDRTRGASGDTGGGVGTRNASPIGRDMSTKLGQTSAHIDRINDERAAVVGGLSQQAMGISTP
jgi:hypothetical protein